MVAIDGRRYHLSASAAVNQARRSPGLTAGFVLLTLIVGIALLAPFVTSYSPDNQNVNQMLLAPSVHHLLGTDELGRDIWSRIVYGTRTDLEIGVGAVAATWIIGSTLGLVAGYLGGIADLIIMRLVDFVMAFPFYVLIIALVFVIGSGSSSLFIALVSVGWVSYARIVRGEVRLATTRDYVLAARMTSVANWKILLRHILPNVVSQPIVYAMSDVVNVILAVVTLGFLGLGVQPPTPEWGTMIAEGAAYLTTRWTFATFPAVAVVLTGVAFSFMGDGIARRIHGD
jgi:peptide/nickel transport system permease protein